MREKDGRLSGDGRTSKHGGGRNREGGNERSNGNAEGGGGSGETEMEMQKGAKTNRARISFSKYLQNCCRTRIGMCSAAAEMEVHSNSLAFQVV